MTPWVYEITTGWLYFNGVRFSQGYSGAGLDKNQPADENVPDMGPIPEGLYVVGQPVTTLEHGPFALPLSPDPANAMYGRTGFMLHGDNKLHPGTASKGCIVQPRFARERVADSGEKLQVVNTIQSLSQAA